MHIWKRCQEPKKGNTVRKRGEFSRKFCVKEGKVSQILQILMPALKMYKTIKA